MVTMLDVDNDKNAASGVALGDVDDGLGEIGRMLPIVTAYVAAS